MASAAGIESRRSGHRPIATLRSAVALLASDPVAAMAMADLAVTGRIAYEALAAMSFQTSADLAARLVAFGADQAAATQVAERVQKVGLGDPREPGLAGDAAAATGLDRRLRRGRRAPPEEGSAGRRSATAPIG